MIYRQLFDRAGPDTIVRAGIIGTGRFATPIITQAQDIPRVDIPVVADLDVEAAREAFRLAGVPDGSVAVCESQVAAREAMDRGQKVIVPDGMLMMELPVEVVVEATGLPEPGARHGMAAIEQGKHVAMVNKETDVTVGPILKHMADEAGVVYTAVDGDQHGLSMGLISWARELGFEVVCAGKSRDSEVVFDAEARTLVNRGETVALGEAEVRLFDPIPPGGASERVAERQAFLDARGLAQVAGYDLVELALTANATGLAFDVEEVRCPALRTAEIPEAMCPTDEGGILAGRGVVDAVSCLRSPSEPGLGGGVFVVVSCPNDFARKGLGRSGLVPNSRGSAFLIYRPHHLLSLEISISILCAHLLRLPTGATELLPRFDVVARAREDLQAGEIVGPTHDPKFQFLVREAQPVAPGTPVPFLLASRNPLTVDVPAGTMITAEMVAPPEDSALWPLRAEQDRLFLDA